MIFQYSSSQFCDVSIFAICGSKKEYKDFSGTRCFIPQMRDNEARQGALPPASHI